jgi:hypothetical protein
MLLQVLQLNRSGTPLAVEAACPVFSKATRISTVKERSAITRCRCRVAKCTGIALKSANWSACSEVSLDSELRNLREIRTNLSECIDSLSEDDVGRNKMAVALSFVQMAIDALSSFQAERAASA